MIQLKSRWVSLNEKYNIADSAYLPMWEYLRKQYSKPKRHYHNLAHLQAMFHQIEQSAIEATDAPILQYSVWFHDVIYNVLRQNNEAKSAIKARQYLKKAGFEQSRVASCVEQIECTKAHQIPQSMFDSSDLALLLDADLEVLGRPWAAYEIYTRQIRQEYRIYPTSLYAKGRKKALSHFLERPFIYHTPSFFDKYEAQARVNIKREIGLL